MWLDLKQGRSKAWPQRLHAASISGWYTSTTRRERPSPNRSSVWSDDEKTKIAGSIIGGIKATEECLDLCAKHDIYPDVQLIEAKDIDLAWQQLIGTSGNKDGVRYVIDVKKSLENKDFLPK